MTIEWHAEHLANLVSVAGAGVAEGVERNYKARVKHLEKQLTTATDHPHP